MVVNKLDIGRAVIRPTKAKAELVVHTDRVLAFAIVLEGFKMVRGRHAKIIQSGSRIEHNEFATQNAGKIGGHPLGELPALQNRLQPLVPVALNGHRRCAIVDNKKRIMPRYGQ